jgi:hypothetical protein
MLHLRVGGMLRGEHGGKAGNGRNGVLRSVRDIREGALHGCWQACAAAKSLCCFWRVEKAEGCAAAALLHSCKGGWKPMPGPRDPIVGTAAGKDNQL